MQIKLYNFSKKNNSTKQPTGGTTVNCVLKENTSVLNPVFILKNNDHTYNYCSWGSRYYFVNDIISLANNYTEYHCSVDALASWKSDIGSSTEYVLRSAYTKDGYIPDMLYPVKAKPTETKLVLSTLAGNFSGSSYIVGIVNKDTGSNGAVTYYSLSSANLKSLMSFLFSSTNYMNINASELSADLTKALVDPFQYIKSCVWYPFNVGGTLITGAEGIEFGWWESGLTGGYIVTESDRIKTFSENVTIPQHPQASVRGKYLNGSPFRRMSGICWTFGHYIINPSYYIEGGNLGVTIDVDLYANQGCLKISDVAGHVVHQAYAPVGVDIPIAQLSSNVLGVAQDLLSGGSNLLYGNIVGYANGLASAIQDMIPQAQSAGSDGSKAAYQMAPTILIEDYLAANDSNTHNGRPLCQDKQISTIPGFMIIDNPDVDIACTEQERDIISAAMSNGFYYE